MCIIYSTMYNFKTSSDVKCHVTFQSKDFIFLKKNALFVFIDLGGWVRCVFMCPIEPCILLCWKQKTKDLLLLFLCTYIYKINWQITKSQRKKTITT